jgi:hypothetical protein
VKWPCSFQTQPASQGNPLMAEIEYQGQTNWQPWSDTSGITLSNATYTAACTNANGSANTFGMGTITLNHVPAFANVGIRLHLDYALKGLTDISSQVSPDPMKKPVTYSGFSSHVASSANAVGSDSSTSTLGRGKKVTMVYGVVRDSAGNALQNVWIALKQGTNTALAQTLPNGSFVFFDGQACNVGDGLGGGCAGASTTTWNFATSNNVSTSLTILGSGASAAGSPTEPYSFTQWSVVSGSTTYQAWTFGSPTNSFSVSKGTAYNRDWKFK